MSVGRSEDDGVDDPHLHQSSVPALTRSWPPSPLSALSSSSQVTARLYSSLQHSREQEVKGHAARQVSFALSSPDLTAVRMPAATPPLLSNRLEDLSLDSTSSRDAIGSGVEGVESESDADGEMDLHLQNSLSRSTQLTVASLHSKVLQFQQQLTLAVAADRKKDIMIEQLDKALSRVEQNLSQVEETLNQEQKHKQELQKTNKRLDQVKQEAAAREEAENRTREIQEELEQIRRDRDTLRVDRALEQTRFEAQKSQMEAEFRLSLERQINERLTAIQEENTTHNAQLRQQHRKQLLDLSARHERELAAQLDQFRTQLQEKDDKLQQLTQTYQHKYSLKMQEELVSMAASKRKLETQREELVCRLQGMMRSHWAEALRLLTNQEQWEASKPSSSPPRSDTHASALSDCSGLWVRPAFSENETLKEMNQGTRETQMKQILNLNHSQCEPNQIRARQKQSHAPTDTRTNHSSSADSGLGRGVASGLWYGSDSDKAPPIRDEAVHSRTRVSSLNDDRQSELQYYLLERSPGDPVDEPIREHKHETERHMSDLRSNPEQKPDQRDKQERAPSRSVQSRRSVSRRGGSQKVWR
ncbi:centrobin isoform X1 [Labeo rohita]|uniref:Centrobin isoform X1 n=1 Tax=Labeo rohita TaxID=84645 RepID=A0A498LLR9_LABRO|nr:centrobin isoform X1 [Labeo rohita]